MIAPLQKVPGHLQQTTRTKSDDQLAAFSIFIFNFRWSSASTAVVANDTDAPNLGGHW